MRAFVCVKVVADPSTVSVDPATGRVDIRRLVHIINPADEAALEVALLQRGVGDEIHVVCVGPKRGEQLLRGALAVGADHVLRLWDDTWSETEPMRTALVLGLASRHLGPPDLIFCGTRSVDRGSGTVPALLAEFLEMAIVTDVTHCEIKGSTTLAERRVVRGGREVVRIEGPVVIAVDSEVAKLRYATLPGMIRAERASIPCVQPLEVGFAEGLMRPVRPLSQETRTWRPRRMPIFKPDSRLPASQRIEQIIAGRARMRKTRLITGPPGEAAMEIVQFVRDVEQTSE